MQERVDILGVNVSVTSPQKACEDILKKIEKGEKAYVCVAPVSTIVDCQKDKKYKDIVKLILRQKKNARGIFRDNLFFRWSSH